MSTDVFGNLQDWGCVLDRIAELRRSRKLDGHQEGLNRLLRYRDNWRLREAALEAAKEVSSPTDALLSQVLAVMMDEGVYWQARALAADALSQLVQKSGKIPAVNASRVAEKMNQLLDTPQAPVFHESIRRSLQAVEKAR
jgi:hypothetical protein